MRRDRQIAACNSTIICQRKQFPLERRQVWVFYNHRRTIITSLLIVIKPGRSDWMSQTSHTQSDTQSITSVVKDDQNRNSSGCIFLCLGNPLFIKVCLCTHLYTCTSVSLCVYIWGIWCTAMCVYSFQVFMLLLADYIMWNTSS